MKCDICPALIALNHQPFVIEEEETGTPGTTLITFAAHRECYDLYRLGDRSPNFNWSAVFGR